MDWIISLGDGPGVTVFSGDGVLIAVTAMLIGTGLDPGLARAAGKDAEEAARKYRDDFREGQVEKPLEYRISLAYSEDFVLVKAAY